MPENTKENTNNKNKKEQATKDEEPVILKEGEYLKLKEGLEKSQEYQEKILRLQADFDNTRKRLEKEKQDFIRFANEGLILELLNILDFYE